jgi:hypothetical protein
MVMELDETEYASVKNSFYNIYSLFIAENAQSEGFHDCIIKWGLQLGISEIELEENLKKNLKFQFKEPSTPLEAIEQVYDLVYMVYLDGIIEDVELEVAMEYAQRLGFKKHIVGDLLKAIVTAPHDGVSKDQVRKELKELLESYS